MAFGPNPDEPRRVRKVQIEYPAARVLPPRLEISLSEPVPAQGLIAFFERFLSAPTAKQKAMLAKMDMDAITALQKYLVDSEIAATAYVYEMVRQAAVEAHARLDYIDDYEPGTPMREFLLRSHESELTAYEDIQEDCTDFPSRARRKIFRRTFPNLFNEKE